MLLCAYILFFTVTAFSTINVLAATPSELSAAELQDVGGVQDITSLPVCGADEFLTVESGQLVCRTPPQRLCPCPKLPRKPPPGCKNLPAPVGGGLICARQPAVIYCSVMCDNSTEFSTSPLNPYLCGRPSGSLWVDFTNNTYSNFPQCTGFRHTVRPIHPEMFYFPAPCQSLSEQQLQQVFEEFLILIMLFGCQDCTLDDIFLQCSNYVV